MFQYVSAAKIYTHLWQWWWVFMMYTNREKKKDRLNAVGVVWVSFYTGGSVNLAHKIPGCFCLVFDTFLSFSSPCLISPSPWTDFPTLRI